MDVLKFKDLLYLFQIKQDKLNPTDLIYILIEKEYQERTCKLDISNCGLTNLPEELFEIVWLEELVVSNRMWNFRQRSWVKSKNKGTPNRLSSIPLEISRLKKLKKLFLSGTTTEKWKIRDISVLSNLSGLKTLDLSSNYITDISVLSDLTALQNLNLYGNQINDISFLSNLTELKTLDLSDNRISDISVLSSLQRLQNLEIYNNNISDIRILSKLSGLKSLDLSNNQINDKSFLSNLTKLETLELRYSQLNDLSFLSNLTKLKTLNLENNQISDLWFLSILPKLQKVNLNNNQISDISFLSTLSELQNLDLGINLISDIKDLSNLAGLQTLDLGINKISDISVLSDLTGLQNLNLRSNEINDISVLSDLKGLKQLDLCENKITNIIPLKDLIISSGLDINWNTSDDGILIEDNPLTTPPPEIVKRGRDAVLRYFAELDEGKDFLFEAKLLIVGEPGAGKTTLFKKLLDNDAPMPKESESTRGIDIHQFTFPVKAENKHEFTVNIWDFGGQEIYHATHQFFLTKRSLYILLSDARKEDTNFNYWLQIIELLASNSPVIIVNNEKGKRKVDFDLRGLSARFSNILTPLHSLDLSKDTGKLDKLREFIQFHIQRLGHVGQVLPKSWISVRKELEILAENNPYISSDTYFNICKKNGLPDTERALFLSGFFHDLGVFLHFQEDPILRHYVILRNEWATNAVYAIVDDFDIRYENKGHFNRTDILRILDQLEYRNMHDAVLQLMINFEFCYLVPEKVQAEYIAPQLLPITKPEYVWDETENLQLRYQYDFMPKGLINRFIIRAHQYISNYHELWRSGTILTRNSTKAEVIETYGRRSIHIRVSGFHKKELLTIISEHLDLLNKGYGGLIYDKMVPCNCLVCNSKQEPHFYRYADLYRRLEMSKLTVECPVSYDDVSVQGLLDDVFITRSDVKPPLKVFISYSNRDKAYLQKLKTFLTPLMIEKNLILWYDNTLIPGEEWDKKIKYELMTADIILFLVSPDLLATEYIWKTEMKEALDRHEKGEARMVPVILRPCLWESSPLARYNVIPEKGKPLSTYSNQDKGWKIITEEIEKTIEREYMIRNR